jgi:uncharacterized protein (DUF1330 family)
LSSKSVPCYLIGLIRVKNYEEYVQRYGMPAMAHLKAAGAELQVAAAEAEPLEGEWPCNWTVVIRFPNKAAATEFYNSPGYAPLRNLRINELTDGGSLVLVEGFDLSVLG